MKIPAKTSKAEKILSQGKKPTRAVLNVASRIREKMQNKSKKKTGLGF